MDELHVPTCYISSQCRVCIPALQFPPSGSHTWCFPLPDTTVEVTRVKCRLVTLLYAAKDLWVSNGWLPPDTSMRPLSINTSQSSPGYGMQHVISTHAKRTSSAAGSIAYNPSVCTAISDAPVCHPHKTSIQISFVPCFPTFCICKILGSTSTCMVARTSALCFKLFSTSLPT